MKDESASQDRYEPASDEDLVSFAVVCKPASGADAEQLRSRLTLTSLDEFLPSDQVLSDVADQLRDLGFEVFDLPGPVVSARGSVAQFRSLFHAELVRRTRTVTTPSSEKSSTTSIVLKPDSVAPSPGPLRGALLISVQSRPHFSVPRMPPPTPDFILHPPGDIAHLTYASATHRLSTASGRATGEGVSVAVLDTGFAVHPYYSDHGYRITRRAMADTSHAENDDDDPHGTLILASLFACAPDVDAYGLKIGEDATLGFRYAMHRPKFKVISVSWDYELGNATVLPDDLVPLKITILRAISKGVTVIAAAGNGHQSTFPAGMPEVIAVGGVEVDGIGGVTAWDGASSFSSVVFGGRRVPDFCAIASRMWSPAPGPDWHSGSGGTSSAAPQVAGIAALLLQKRPDLTPAMIRDVLAITARDVTDGTTATGHRARRGRDLATGTGFVNALEAWRSV